MRSLWVVLVPGLLGPACVLDRTGQSTSSQFQRELAIQGSRTAENERMVNDLGRRMEQLEEVVRYQGRQEAEKLDNMEQVVAEVRRLRGELELLSHGLTDEEQSATTFREDADFRLGYMEARVQSLEGTLGVSPPPPPEMGLAAGEVETVATPGEEPVEPEVVIPETVAQTPDALMGLAEGHIEGERPAAARAVLTRFLKEHPDDPRAVEARYLLADTFFLEEEYQQAVLRFEDVVQASPKSKWAGQAMLRQGECFSEMGRETEAELFWEDVLSRYPGSEAARQAKEHLRR